MDSADPSFPRPAGFWWFGCSSIDQGIAIASATTSTTTESSDWGLFWPWQSDQSRADVPVSYDDDDDDDFFAGQDSGSNTNYDNDDDQSQEDFRPGGRDSFWTRVKDVVKGVLGSRIG